MTVPWEKIEPKLGSWAPYFKSFYDGGGFEKIYTTLREQGKTTKIVPEGKDLFRAFEMCPKDKLKSIWLCMSPYFMIKDGLVVADGLAFSCSHTKQEQPSLKLIYDAIEDDLYDGLNLNMLRNPDLAVWAEQGVLLLNVMLTTTLGEAKAHKELWKPFIEYFLKEVLIHFSGIPVVFIGNEAQEYENYVSDKSFHIKSLEHPAYAARQNRPWKHQNLFSWTNNILMENNGEGIAWLEEPPF